MNRIRLSAPPFRLLPAALLAAAVPGNCAQAQEMPSDDASSVYSGDFIIVGGGIAALPSYEGSNDTKLIPAVGLAGRVKGVSISPRAAGASFDLIDDRESRIGLILGPVLRYRFNRSGPPRDPVVELLGRRKGGLEGGINAGISARHVLSHVDSLSFSVDLRWDLSGHGAGMIASPGMSYLTPLSRSKVAGLAVAANFVDAAYARYAFSVSPVEGAASGLPAFGAKGGLKDVSAGVFVAQDLNGNLLDGGPAIGVGVMYSRLYNSAARTPLTAIRGSADQWFGGVGIAWVFGL